MRQGRSFQGECHCEAGEECHCGHCEAGEVTQGGVSL